MMRPDAPGSDAVAGHARPRGPDAAARVGRIRFVNCFPLYHHFAEQLSARGVSADIVDGYPSDLNDMLARGAIDVTLSSSIAFARNADAQVLLPQVSISSFGAVDSIQLFARTPPARIRRVAVTEKSATSICLLKVLCREWGIEPEFAPRRGPLSEILEEFDALLLIGDEALHLLRVEAYPYHYDLGAEWKDLTGLPMVYAVCAARQDFVAARPEAAAAVGVALLASRDACAAAPEATAAAAAQVYDFSRAYLEDYFDKLKFGFTPEYRAGLQEFYRRAAEAGELERVPDLEVCMTGVC
ncbi:MAG TPA: menaquinone biosynthesis protein [Thermoleophilia bacterium]|jgi:chorismate dehydratase|nr:menaquinone biosynthesis protein [Thermoleophilia bacterium]